MLLCRSAGELFSVAPLALAYTPNSFVLNERIALNGTWKHGCAQCMHLCRKLILVRRARCSFYSFVPVGAFNVGSIRLTSEPVCPLYARQRTRAL